MGCPVATIQNKSTMIYTRASTTSRNASEERCKVLHNAASGTPLPVQSITEEERVSLLKPSPLHHVARKKAFGNVQCRHPGKQSAVSFPSYQRLDPESPSESYSSSKISNLGSSSSSSPSSTSTLNETATFAVEELSPVRATGLEGKQAWYSPTRERYQGCSTPSKTWDDSEMQFKSSLFKPIDDHFPTRDVSNGAAAGARNSKTTQHQRISIAKGSEFDRELDIKSYIPHVPVRHLAEVRSAIGLGSSFAPNVVPSQVMLKGFSDVKHESGSFKPSLGPASHQAAPSKHKCRNTHPHSDRNTSSALVTREYIQIKSKDRSFKHSREQDSWKDVKAEIYGDDLSDACHDASKMSRGGFRPCHMKGPNPMQGSAHNSSRFTNSNALPISAPGCSSAPYEADIGIDACSVQLQAKCCSPATKMKPLRSSSLQQPIHAMQEVPHLLIPTTPETKLDAKHSADSVYTKSSTEKHTCKASMPGKERVSQSVPAQQESRDKLGANLHVVNSHSYYGMRQDAKPNFAPVSKTRVYDTQSWTLVNDGKYTEKADAFTPHAPLLPKASITYREGPKPNPSFPSSSKSHWDWRSKSLGAKASIKSVVRSLETTFTASRSLSLPKTRSDVRIEPKFDNSKLLDRVLISPMRARSKQTGILTPMDRPGKKRIELKDDCALQRRDAKVITSNLSSSYDMPRNSLPSGYNNVETSCKPFFPASKSARCLPVPRNSLPVPGAETSDSSGRNSSGFLSHSSKTPSTGMSQAQLHSTFIEGIPCYTMTVEGSEEVMLAKASWVESHASREDCKWQYFFYSGQGRSKGIGATGWRNWIKKDNKTTSDLSGVMKISVTTECKALPASKGLKVLEFVLYDGRGAELSRSQSFRFCSSDKPYPYLWSKGSTSSVSHSCSENVQLLSPACSDMTINRQHGENLTDSCADSEKAATAVNATTIHKNTGYHRSSLSLDAWSDSEVPDSAQSATPFSPSQVELAAMVIQLPAEGDSHFLDCNYVSPRPQIFLTAISKNEVSHAIFPGVAQAEKSMALNAKMLDQNWYGSIWPCADPNFVSSGSYRCAGGGLNQIDNYVNTKENFQNLQSIANFGRRTFVGTSTLLLPRGEHSFPISGSKGPSSLIERWRSGGSCECGGWDLGCGINVISSECSKVNITQNKEASRPAAYDQQFSLFSQGSMPQLMLGLSPVKQGEFKLRFQSQLSPLRMFAAAVAILHSHQSSLLDLSQALASSTSERLPRPWPTSTNVPSATLFQSFTTSSTSIKSLTPSTSRKLPPPAPTSSTAPFIASLQSTTPSSSLLSPSVGHHIVASNYIGRPPRPPQNYLVAPGRSDSSSKDKISPLPAHILQLN
ncbi:hypothetical protein L7F22_026157 [Adiantum nelumboides]|nr:hypothetical protein [Adiantum nelumboides]